MTWVSGAWSPSAWAAGAWPGSSVDSDIPVNVAAAFFAALTAVGQPGQTAQVVADVQPSLQVAPTTQLSTTVAAPCSQSLQSTATLTLSTQVSAESTASKSILGQLYTGWSVTSAYTSSFALAPTMSTGLQVRPTVSGVSALVGSPVTDLRTNALSTCSFVLADGPGVAQAFSGAGAGTSAFTGSVYAGWPVAGGVAAVSTASGVAGLSVSPAALSAAALTTSIEWKLDQGLAGTAAGEGTLTLNPTTSRGLAGSSTLASDLTSQVGITYAATGSTSGVSALSGGLGLTSQVAGSASGSFNTYGLLNQDMQVRGSVASLLAVYWSNLPPVAPTEMALIDRKQWSVVDGGGGIVFKPPTRLLSSVSLRLDNYVLASRPSLTVTPSERLWAFDPQNSEYTFEGNSHESYGPQGSGRDQNRQLRLQSGDRNF